MLSDNMISLSFLKYGRYNVDFLAWFDDTEEGKQPVAWLCVCVSAEYVTYSSKLLEGVVAASVLRCIVYYVCLSLQPDDSDYVSCHNDRVHRARCDVCSVSDDTKRHPVGHALAVIPQWQWIALQTASEPWTDNMGGDRFTAQSQPSSYALWLLMVKLLRAFWNWSQWRDWSGLPHRPTNPHTTFLLHFLRPCSKLWGERFLWLSDCLSALASTLLPPWLQRFSQGGLLWS